MKLEAPSNSNYAAVCIDLPPLKSLEGSDFLVGAPLLGFQAVISKDHRPTERGVVFPAESQLSEQMCRENNLFRHQDKNKDPDAKGYLEDTRRVRAIKLRGHRSDCLWLPLESLAWTGANVSELRPGDCFDTLNGQEICRKYVIRTRESRGRQAKKEKRFERVDPRLFPEHEDTANWFREKDRISPEQWVHVTQKIHGTSVRLGRTLVLRKLPLRDRIASKFGVKVQTQEWDAVAGSRKVIKDPNNPEQNHFYGDDIWTQHLDRVEHLIPEGFLVFGEIIGWTREGAPIQSGYTYCLPDHTSELYVYRVAMINPRGVLVDLSWPQVREWCAERELKHVPDLWEGRHSEFIAEDWIDRRFADEGYDALPLGPDKKLVDEGVCVRADGLVPVILKVKSPQFNLHETSLLDQGEVDIESRETEGDDLASTAV